MLLLRGGTVYDGTGAPGRRADVLVREDRVVAVGAAPHEFSGEVVDVSDLAVTPGFINVLSHAWNTMHRDRFAISDLLQGVTTVVFGEAFSVGPADDSVDALISATFGADPEIQYTQPSLREGLTAVAAQGLGPNAASLVGGTNLRLLTSGHEPRPLSPQERERACALLRDEMQDGAFGVGTALIYPPATFTDDDELRALCEVVAAADGIYMSHLRSEGDRLIENIDGLIDLSRQTGVRASVYHLKAVGRDNWHKMSVAVDRIEAARAEGLPVSANMYPYRAGATALMSAIPPWHHRGGPGQLAERLADPVRRQRVATDLADPASDYENLFLACGGGTGILLLSDVKDVATRGRLLAQVAQDIGMTDAETLVELVRQEPTVGAAFFMMSEDNVELGLRQPWVSIGSDAAAHPPEPPWTAASPHPRTYGSFARILGHYVRDRRLFSFAEAVRRMTSLPAEQLRLRDRGVLVEGAFADIAVLDPTTVADRATFEAPHQLAAGVQHVLVNGEPVVRDGALTGLAPGRVLCR